VVRWQKVDHGTVAVIIPTHNRRELVCQAVRSVLEQTYPDFRCIVVDNGSNDGTAEALASLNDPRITVLAHESPLGPAGARNLGIAEAKTEQWVAFLDSDDLWAPKKLELQLSALAANPGVLCSATAYVITSAELTVTSAVRMNTGPLLPVPAVVEADQLLGQLRDNNYVSILTSAVLASRELVVSAGPFDTALAMGEDWDHYLRLASESPFAFVDEPLVAYRVWGGQTKVEDGPMLRAMVTIRYNHLLAQDAPYSPHSRALWEQGMARKHLVAGRKGSAALCYLRAAHLGRAPGQVVYALCAATLPRLVQRRLDHISKARNLPAGWEEAAESWLAPYRCPAGGREVGDVCDSGWQASQAESVASGEASR
jgi:GT2 family glycosyltransferase